MQLILTGRAAAAGLGVSLHGLLQVMAAGSPVTPYLSPSAHPKLPTITWGSPSENILALEPAVISVAAGLRIVFIWSPVRALSDRGGGKTWGAFTPDLTARGPCHSCVARRVLGQLS